MFFDDVAAFAQGEYVVALMQGSALPTSERDRLAAAEVLAGLVLLGAHLGEPRGVLVLVGARVVVVVREHGATGVSSVMRPSAKYPWMSGECSHGRCIHRRCASSFSSTTDRPDA